MQVEALVFTFRLDLKENLTYHEDFFELLKQTRDESVLNNVLDVACLSLDEVQAKSGIECKADIDKLTQKQTLAVIGSLRSHVEKRYHNT